MFNQPQHLEVARPLLPQASWAVSSLPLLLSYNAVLTRATIREEGQGQGSLEIESQGLGNIGASGGKP
jgi:hypothetical protein